MYRYIKSNLSLYSLFYAEACNEFAEPFSASMRPGNTAPSKECRSGGEPLATQCPTGPAQDLNLKPPAPETNALSLDQLAGRTGRQIP